jgi:glycosyltransferase involved in cell wall biosynthesis
MNILLFTQQLAAFRSGVGTYTHGLITGLMNLGHQITVVVPENEKIEIPGVKILTTPRSRIDPTPGGWLSLGLSFAKILSDRAIEFDIAHFTDAREAWRVYHSPIPVTGMANDSYALDWLDIDFPRKMFVDRYLRSLYYGFLRIMERRTYRHLAGLAINGNYVGRKVISNYHLNPKKVQLIHIGLPEQSPILSNPLAGSPSLIFVGGNFQRKGLSVLFKAVARLLPHFPTIRLHIVGKDRNQPFFIAQARKLGIANAVKFHGSQPNEQVRGMMSGADIFVLPSLTESFGLVYLEAMRVGTPVIATARGEMKEIFVENEEILFVDPEAEEGLAQAIEVITLNTDMASRLRTRGQTAAKRFTVDMMGKATEDFFIKILKNNSLSKNHNSDHKIKKSQ